MREVIRDAMAEQDDLLFEIEPRASFFNDVPLLCVFGIVLILMWL